MAHRMRLPALLTFALSVALALAGCSSTASTNPGAGGSGAGGGTTATPIRGATVTSAPTTCAQLPGFGGALAISLIAAPPNTVATSGAAGNHYLPLCSAGSGASVMAFLAEAMPAFGWQSRGTNAWKRTVGSNIWYVEFGGPNMGNPITNAQNWLQDTHPPQPA